jgi:hypothetical protein
MGGSARLATENGQDTNKALPTAVVGIFTLYFLH